MAFHFVTVDIRRVVACLEARNITDFVPKSQLRTDIVEYVLVFEFDTCISELYQWAAAAFACGLIESPRIERM